MNLLRPNLSFEKWTAVLAAIGTGSIVGCAGREPQPVAAHEVAPVTSSAATTSPQVNGTSVPSAPVTPSAAAPPVATTPGGPSSVGSVGAPVADPATPSVVSDDVTPKPASKPAQIAAKKAAAPKPAAGEASCGAGTCGGDTTTKIL
jgi:hypothetical protein